MAIEELQLRHASVTAKVAPARGALATALTVAGREVLYLDRATLEDPGKSVRGGIPLLFPFAGRLVDDRLVYAGTVMKQHGFARNRAWRVGEHRADFLQLSLDDDADSRATYPHALRLTQSFSLLPRGLAIELACTNRGGAPMPVSPGWHPYFRCPSAAKPNVKPLDAPNLDPARFTPDAEFDFGVAAPVDGRASFEIPELGQLALSFSPELRFLQCWGLPGRDFICLEPFLGPNNTINTAARLDIAPGKTHTFRMAIELG